MTTVKITACNNTTEIAIDGHAEYNPSGQDIVCSACSVLSYTLLQCVLEMESEGVIGLQEDISDGRMFIRAVPNKQAKQRLETVINVISSGFLLLEQQYPEHVKIFL